MWGAREDWDTHPVPMADSDDDKETTASVTTTGASSTHGDEGRQKRRPLGGRGGGGRNQAGRKRVKREQNRQLHRNWSFVNRFLIALVLIYLVPTGLEFYYAWAVSGGCEAGLHIWLLIDGAVTTVFMTEKLYATLAMHWGLQEDPELADYLLVGARYPPDYPGGPRRRMPEDLKEKMELRYTLLHKKSNVCPNFFSYVPFGVSVIGIFLWLSARGAAEGSCDPLLITASGWIVLFKVLAPVIIGAIYGCSFLLLMTGVRRTKKRGEPDLHDDGAGIHQDFDDLSDEDRDEIEMRS